MESETRDENLSWKAASVIMSLVTIVTVTTRLLGTDPFTDIFDLFIVYTPTAVLLGSIVGSKLRRSGTPKIS